MKPASATVNTGELREGSASVAGVVGVSFLSLASARVLPVEAGEEEEAEVKNDRAQTFQWACKIA